jgi:hypothetical protein
MKWVKEGEYGRGTFYTCINMEHNPVEVILRRGRGKRQNNGEDELNQDILYAHMEMSEQHSLYNYYMLTKT